MSQQRQAVRDEHGGDVLQLRRQERAERHQEIQVQQRPGRRHHSRGPSTDEEQQLGEAHRDELAAFHDAEAFGEQPGHRQRDAGEDGQRIRSAASVAQRVAAIPDQVDGRSGSPGSSGCTRSNPCQTLTAATTSLWNSRPERDQTGADGDGATPLRRQRRPVPPAASARTFMPADLPGPAAGRVNPQQRIERAQRHRPLMRGFDGAPRGGAHHRMSAVKHVSDHLNRFAYSACQQDIASRLRAHALKCFRRGDHRSRHRHRLQHLVLDAAGDAQRRHHDIGGGEIRPACRARGR